MMLNVSTYEAKIRGEKLKVRAVMANRLEMSPYDQNE